MGKKSGTNTVTQNASPWGPAVGSLKLGLDELNRAYKGQFGGAPNIKDFYYQVQTGTRQQPSGPFDPRAGPQPMRDAPVFENRLDEARYNQALAEFEARNQGVSGPVEEFGLLGSAGDVMRDTIEGRYMNSNPYLEDTIARAMADTNSNFSGMSRYGSGAHMDALFSRASAPFRYANYESERARQLAAAQGAAGFELGPYQVYSARTAAPFEPVRNYLDLANVIAGRGGTTSSSQPIYSNPMAGALGGAMGGAALGSMMAAPGVKGLAAVGGWPFLLGGALLGGLASS